MNVTGNEQENQKVVPLFRSGDYFFHRGIEAYRKKHLHRAIKLFERAVKLTAKEPVFHVQLAAVLSEIGEYERSNEILQQVLVNENDEIAECYFFMANNYAYLGFFEKAERMTLRYLELGDDERFTDDAKNLLDLLRFERDEDEFDGLVEEEDELLAQHERAHYLLREGNVETAIPLLRTIIKEHPTYWAAQNHLAEALYRLGTDREEAYMITLDVLEKDPGNLIAICNLALFYAKDGQTKEAEIMVESLQCVYPMDGDHYVKVAETLCDLGQYQLAYERLRDFNKYELEIRPTLLFCLGVAAYHAGKDNAISIIERAAFLGCEQAELYTQQDNLSTIHYEMWSDET
ncbi:tetratricopeptide repeat protein [Bacillus suaedae]|uniref:Tetratricopeptide repeat protein n=1 Tax=Halalkalibacter suaedae TaxID=2822140 RepID=A0A941AN68_9BACI|nr:tetratricopeptide repeat protein [Bacillus suaedae]MBP3949977.1 tetratricopeptide repeat protein [Bacillus suaedae]